jgi:hypothetical protein
MSNRAIFIRWGMPLAGRERLAVEEFGSYLNWVTQLKKEGKIERFEVYGPTTGNLEAFTGFTIVEGKEDPIAELVASEEFRIRVNRLMLLAHGAHVDVCDVGEGVGARMKLYATAVTQLKL